MAPPVTQMSPQTKTFSPEIQMQI
jgi:hypothetical protein